MSNKTLDVFLRKEFKKIGRDYQREKARCAKLYPDWEDNEFNMLDNLFIWGYNTNKNVTPSFHSWDDAYIYYNRATQKFYMIIDTGFYNQAYEDELARIELNRLDRINEAFGDFLIEKGLPLKTEIFPFNNPALEAETLTELYTKFRIMLEGYKFYRNIENEDKIN